MDSDQRWADGNLAFRGRENRAAHLLSTADYPIQIGTLQQHIHQRAEASAVVLIEARHMGTIKIEDPQELSLVNQRNHDLRTRRRVAGDVSRKGMYVLDDDGLPALRGRAADT